MISLVLRDMRGRMMLLAGVVVAFYFLEEGFHQHEAFDAGVVALGPVGISATLANIAGLAMIILMSGSISADRREGYSRLFFAHPTSPLAFYGLRWAIAFGVAVTAAVLFLVFGQILAWGEFLGGWSGLILPVLSALIFGGLTAFFSTVLPRGEGWVVFLLLLPTFFPEIINVGLQGFAPWLRQLVLVLLPPQTTAMNDIWLGLLFGPFRWGAVLFAAGYGAALLLAAGLIIRLREWP